MNLGWIGAVAASPWTRKAAALGTRDDIMEGIYEALKAEHAADAGAEAAGTVTHDWIKQRIDQYLLRQLDEDARAYVAKRFETDGARIQGK